MLTCTNEGTAPCMTWPPASHGAYLYVSPFVTRAGTHEPCMCKVGSRTSEQRQPRKAMAGSWGVRLSSPAPTFELLVSPLFGEQRSNEKQVWLPKRV